MNIKKDIDFRLLAYAQEIDASIEREEWKNGRDVTGVIIPKADAKALTHTIRESINYVDRDMELLKDQLREESKRWRKSLGCSDSYVISFQKRDVISMCDMIDEVCG